MVEFINSLTGSRMFVEDSRKEEYLKMGHKLVSSSFISEEKKPKRKRTVKKEK